MIRDDLGFSRVGRVARTAKKSVARPVRVRARACVLNYIIWEKNERAGRFGETPRDGKMIIHYITLAEIRSRKESTLRGGGGGGGGNSLPARTQKNHSAEGLPKYDVRAGKVC